MSLISDSATDTSSQDGYIIRYLNAWLIPGVTIYALTFGCVKGVFYNLGFWLPNYLDNLHTTDVALIVSMIDLGTIFGAIIIWLKKIIPYIYSLVTWDIIWIKEP